jgi:hypothetical protein
MLSNQKVKDYFYRYYGLFYLLFFVLIGVIIWLLLSGKPSSILDARITKAEERLQNCDCNCLDVVDTVPLTNGSDSSRVIKYNGQFGCLSFSLIWNSLDDLDLHVIDPSNAHIFFQQYCKSRDNAFTNAGGQLDIDMNAGENVRQDPVENVYFKCTPPDGIYKVGVHAYRKVGNRPLSFEVQIRKDGELIQVLNGTVSKSNDFIDIINYKLDSTIQYEGE